MEAEDLRSAADRLAGRDREMMNYDEEGARAANYEEAEVDVFTEEDNHDTLSALNHDVHISVLFSSVFDVVYSKCLFR